MAQRQGRTPVFSALCAEQPQFVTIKGCLSSTGTTQSPIPNSCQAWTWIVLFELGVILAYTSACYRHQIPRVPFCTGFKAHFILFCPLNVIFLSLQAASFSLFGWLKLVLYDLRNRRQNAHIRKRLMWLNVLGVHGKNHISAKLFFFICQNTNINFFFNNYANPRSQKFKVGVQYLSVLDTQMFKKMQISHLNNFVQETFSSSFLLHTTEKQQFSVGVLRLHHSDHVHLNFRSVFLPGDVF